MQKILLAIIASAVAVTMLSSFGTLIALATPSSVTGNPGAPTNVCGLNPTTGVVSPTPGNPNGASPTPNGNGIGAAGGGGAHNPNSQASASYPTSTNGQPGGAQYDASCHQQSSNPGHSGP